jgi:hypothetical protein
MCGRPYAVIEGDRFDQEYFLVELLIFAKRLALLLEYLVTIV